MRGLSITKRFVGIVGIGAVIIGLLGLFVRPLTSFIFVNSIILAAWLLDYLLSRQALKVEIQRIGSEKLGIGNKEHIQFEIKNRGDFIVKGELIDEWPDNHFKVPQEVISFTLMPKEKKVLSYEVTPTKRGAFLFEQVHIRMKGRLGLSLHYERFPLEREYKVYPDLQALKKYHLSMYKTLLEREGRKVVRKHAQGTAFESLKAYQVGDAYRHINWRASARSDQPIVNQYEPEKNQRVYAFIDAGRPMSYTLRGLCKLDKAISTALVLTDTVGCNGDLAGMMYFNEKVGAFVPPGKGSGHRQEVMETLFHIEATRQTSNYEDAFLSFRNKERHKSILFMFTDFDTYDEADLLAKAASYLEKLHILVVVLMKNKDIEEMTTKEVKTEEAIYDKAVALDLLEERKKAIARLSRKNVMCIETEPEQLELTVVNKYIEIKNKLGI